MVIARGQTRSDHVPLATDHNKMPCSPRQRTHTLHQSPSLELLVKIVLEIKSNERLEHFNIFVVR